MQQDTENVRKFTGWHMLAIMIAFFGTIIAVNIAMATIASRTWTGLVVENSYVASQAFNTHLAAARKQQHRKFAGSIDYRHGGLELKLLDQAGKPVHLDKPSAQVGRPAHEQQDRTIALTYQGSGIYRAAQALAPGHWLVSVKAELDGEPFRLDRRLLIRKGDK